MKVSVFLVTYNQERFIRQAIESILNQHVNFLYEVIIGEDCSTDGTAAICDEYAEKYPFVKVFHHNPNKGLIKNWEFVLSHCSGDYVAMLEGDDYWIDEHKMQKQVDWLDTHPEYSIVCSNINVVYEGNNCKEEKIFPKREQREYTQGEVLKDWIVLTSSVMFRNDHKPIIYPKDIYVNDTYTFLNIMRRGKCYLFSETMTAYRRHDSNITRTELDIQSDVKWAIQYTYFAKHLYSKKLRSIASEREDEWLQCVINAPAEIKGVLSCRMRYLQKHPRLLFSPFFKRTILHYTSIRKLRKRN